MGWLVFILLFLDYSSCLNMSIFRYLYTRIRESILLSSYFSRVIRQSPYQFRLLAVINRCVYRPSVVQLFVWVFVCVCLVAFYLSLHCSRVSLRAHPLSLPHYLPTRFRKTLDKRTLKRVIYSSKDAGSLLSRKTKSIKLDK